MHMNIMRLACLLAGLCSAAAAWAGTNSVAATNALWFPVGEKLSYRLYWGVVPVGSAEFSSEWVEEDGHRYLALRAKAKSSAAINKVYPIDDYVESLVDPATFLPVRYTQKLKEGRKVRHDVTEFDYPARRAYVTANSKKRSEIVTIEADTRDVVCLSYYMRSQQYKGDEKRKFTVLVDDDLFDLEVNFVGTETVDVKGVGKVPCLKVEPKAKFGEIFVRKGKVLLWFSNDPRHVAVRMTGKVPVGSVRACLVKVDGAGSEAWPRPGPVRLASE